MIQLQHRGGLWTAVLYLSTQPAHARLSRVLGFPAALEEPLFWNKGPKLCDTTLRADSLLGARIWLAAFHSSKSQRMQQPCCHLCAGMGDWCHCCHVCGLIRLLLPRKPTIFPLKSLGSYRKRVYFGQRGAWITTCAEATALAYLSRADQSSNCNKMQVIAGFNTCSQQVLGSSICFGLKPWPAAHRRG